MKKMYNFMYIKLSYDSDKPKRIFSNGLLRGNRTKLGEGMSLLRPIGQRVTLLHSLVISPT